MNIKVSGSETGGSGTRTAYHPGMQILSRLLLLIGLIVLVGGIGVLLKGIYDVNIIHAVAISNRSASYYNPRNELLLTAALTTVGGFLTGLGLTMPRR